MALMFHEGCRWWMSRWGDSKRGTRVLVSENFCDFEFNLFGDFRSRNEFNLFDGVNLGYLICLMELI